MWTEFTATEVMSSWAPLRLGWSPVASSSPKHREMTRMPTGGQKWWSNPPRIKWEGFCSMLRWTHLGGLGHCVTWMRFIDASGWIKHLSFLGFSKMCWWGGDSGKRKPLSPRLKPPSTCAQRQKIMGTGSRWVTNRRGWLDASWGRRLNILMQEYGWQ